MRHVDKIKHPAKPCRSSESGSKRTGRIALPARTSSIHRTNLVLLSALSRRSSAHGRKR
jgi:hypothetical protein